MKTQLPAGFVIKVEMKIFGKDLKFSSTVNLPNELTFSAESPEIDWADGMIIMTKRTDDKKTGPGPNFEFTIGTDTNVSIFFI